MKRIALTTLTLLAVATASAEYTVNIPLEQNQGGSLPNGSIILKSSNDEPLPEAASTECRYTNYPDLMRRAAYYWPENTDFEYLAGKTDLTWEQIVVGRIDGTNGRFQSGGFWYYVGDKIIDYEYSKVTYYEICREPI